MEKFELIAERLKKKLLLRTDKDLAEKLGLKPTTFNARKKAGSIPYSEIMALANCYNLDLNWVFKGEPCPGSDKPIEKFIPQPPSKKENVIVIKHKNLVSLFKNPEKGMENNKHLIGIEKTSSQLYDKVSEYLKTTYEAAKITRSEIEEQKKQSIKKQANGD